MRDTAVFRKLDQYINRKLSIQVLRQVILGISGFGLLALFFLFIEYNVYLSPEIKPVIFYGFTIGSVAFFSLSILPKILQYFNLFRRQSYTSAASEIGKHYPEIQDKLLNIIELYNNSYGSKLQIELREQAIIQKIQASAQYSFRSIFPFSSLRRQLFYIAPVLIVSIGVLIINKNIFTEASERLVRYNTNYTPPAPFEFEHNIPDEIEKNKPFEIKLSTPGYSSVDPYTVIINGQAYSMKVNQHIHTFYLPTIKENLEIQFQVGKYFSEVYQVTAIGKSSISDILVTVNPPIYTGQPSVTYQKLQNITVLEGSRLEYSIQVENAQSVDFRTSSDSIIQKFERNNNQYQASITALTDAQYQLFCNQGNTEYSTSYKHNISVITDEYPQVEMAIFLDSFNLSSTIVAIDYSDDYGINSSYFSIQLEGKINRIPVKIKRNAISGNQTFTLEDIFKEIPEGSFQLAFSAIDNDAIHNGKKSSTGFQPIYLPTKQELLAKSDKQDKEIDKALREKIQQVKALKAELKEFKEEVKREGDNNWMKQDQLNELLKQKQQLNKDLEKLAEQFNQRNELKEQTRKENQKSQLEEQLEDLFTELNDPKEQELLEKIQDLLGKMDKEEMIDQLDEMEMSQEQAEQSLEQLEQLFEKLQVEQKTSELIDKLNDLSKEQEDLKNEVAESESQDKQKNQDNKKENQKNPSQDDLAKQQEEIEDKFSEIQKELDQLENMNEQMKKPLLDELSDLQEQAEETKENIENSKENLQKGNNKSAQKQQKKSTEQMEEMAESLQEQMDGNQMEQLQIDMAAVKQLLENLVSVSKDQEDVMETIRIVSTQLPKYREQTRRQFDIVRKQEMISDSLIALGKRVPQINGAVRKQLQAIDYNIEKVPASLAEKQKGEAMNYQQYVMTAQNELAVLLDDVLQNMQQEMSSKMKGTQNCQKPGSGQKMPGLMQQQQQLSQEMQQAEEKMKKEGGKKPGQSGRGGSSEQLAKMARQQAEIRRAIQKMIEEKQSTGEGTGNLRKLAEEMEKVEEDIIFNNIRKETFERQRDIMVRMLESEKAEREQRESPERESQLGFKSNRRQPAGLEEYLRKRNQSIDQYNTIPGSLKPEYNKLTEEYFKHLQPLNR